MLPALRNRVVAAAAAGTPLRIRGGGTKDFLGGAPEGEILDVRGHAGVIDYDPAELVITARTGTPLGEIESLLASKNQVLPFEPPHFGDAATIGGCIAAGLAGPRRSSTGAVRDFVLGVTMLDGRGQVLRFGGQVMKNVAGFDVARVVAGSLGILGILLDVSIKLLPRAPLETTLVFEGGEASALDRLNTWAGQPLPISASAWSDGTLHVRLSGAVAAVEKCCRTLGGERVDDARGAARWAGVREQTDPFFTQRSGTLWRCAIPSTAPPLGFDEPTLIEWGGAQRWVRAPREAADATRIRERVRRSGGHAVAFRDRASEVPAFDALTEPLLSIHRRLKSAFDPAGIFNRGRLHPDI